MKRSTPNTITPERKQIFLEALAESANVSASSKKAGISRISMYAARHRDPEFAAAWDDAMEHAIDTLEAEVRRRALKGVEKPIYQMGQLVGTVREYSDTLAIFLLKGHRPNRFAERMVHVDAAELDRKIEAELAKLSGQLDGTPAKPSELIN